MDAFQTHYADIRDPAQQSHIAAQLRDQGLVTFSGITDPALLVTVAQRLMAIRPHRDAGPDGVTVITGTGTKTSGYAAFTDAELIPHTDGSSVPDPPGLLVLACQQTRRPRRGDAGRRRRTHHRNARWAVSRCFAIPDGPAGCLLRGSRRLLWPGLRTSRTRADAPPAPTR